jgi:hypothetical protein|tara:strand:+ start:545 stop:1159 length:615 start_codon:yes stop_codon:yes gene_type:complete
MTFMRPAARSTFDILHWLAAQDWPRGRVDEPAHMIRLLYLAQALYAAGHKQRKLMPATFLATAAGPMEPDIYIALENGLKLTKALEPSTEVENFLISFHKVFRDFAKVELDLLFARDSALRAAMARGRNAEITLADMASAYVKGIPAPSGNTQSLMPGLNAAGRSDIDAAPNAKQEVRFTADGRSVTRWMPKKRIISRDLPALN